MKKIIVSSADTMKLYTDKKFFVDIIIFTTYLGKSNDSFETTM